jgi:hypothetical protein
VQVENEVGFAAKRGYLDILSRAGDRG